MVRLLWPVGVHVPGEVVDLDGRMADVFYREGWAEPADESPLPAPVSQAPTVGELRSLQHERGLASLNDAKHVWRDEHRRRDDAR